MKVGTRTRHVVMLEIVVDEPWDLVEDAGDPDNYEVNPAEEVDKALKNAFEEMVVDGVQIRWKSISLIETLGDEV